MQAGPNQRHAIFFAVFQNFEGHDKTGICFTLGQNKPCCMSFSPAEHLIDNLVKSVHANWASCSGISLCLRLQTILTAV